MSSSVAATSGAEQVEYINRLKEQLREKEEKGMFLPFRYIGYHRKLKLKQENPFFAFALSTNMKQTCTGVIRCSSRGGRRDYHILKRRKYTSKRHQYVANFGGEGIQEDTWDKFK